MSDKMGPRDLEGIDLLIQGEVDSALRKFRAGDFEARARHLIEADRRPAKRPMPLLVKIALPAAGAVLVLAVVAAISVFAPSPGPVWAPVDAGTIATVLREMPPFSGQAADLAAGPAGEQALSGAGGAIASVLSAVGAATGAQTGPGQARADVRKAAPLTMKKRMEILFKDKVIERVLLSWAAKAKEA